MKMFPTDMQCKRAVLATAVFASALPHLVLAQSADLEQIVVTARKRLEASIDVPISMDVISGATMQDFHLTTLAELANFSSNAGLFEDMPGAGIPTWVIRGVGLQDFNSNNTPTAGVYVDGAYQVATVMGNAALFDVAQLEVLKGPQGGLYGRNTTGGAVLLSSNRAQLGQYESALSASYARWQQTQVTGMVNVPFADNVALRLSANVEDGRDGWQQSLATGDSHGEKQRYDLRSWLTWQLSDGWSARWKVQGGKDDSDITLGSSIGLYDRSRRPGLCQPLLQGQRDDSQCLSFAGANRLAFGRPELIEPLTAQSGDGRVVLSSPLNTQTTDYVSTLVELEWLSDDFSFKSLSAYDHYDYGVALDLDGSNGEFGHRISTSDIEVFSQEFRIGSVTPGALQWLVGVVLSDERFSERRDFNLRDNLLVGLGRGRLNYEQDTESQAVYGDLTWAFSERLSLNATARYTNEDKSYYDGDFYTPTANPFYLVKDLAADYQLQERLTGSFTLSYQLNETQLVYASVSRAFKSGGFYGGFPFSAVEITPYGEEVLVAKELGYKRQWSALDLTLEAALFSYDYQDVQGFVRSINPLTGTAIDQLDNQSDARHDGAELKLLWNPAEGWQVATTLGWLDARFVPGGKTTLNMLRQQIKPEGQRPYAPKWDGNVEVSKRAQLGTGHNLLWSVHYHFNSDSSGQQSSLVDAAINKLPAISTLAASLTWEFADSPWSVQLWGQNLADKVYRTRVKNDGLNSFIEFFGQPRSFGLGVSAQF